MRFMLTILLALSMTGRVAAFAPSCWSVRPHRCAHHASLSLRCGAPPDPALRLAEEELRAENAVLREKHEHLLVSISEKDAEILKLCARASSSYPPCIPDCALRFSWCSLLVCLPAYRPRSCMTFTSMCLRFKRWRESSQL